MAITSLLPLVSSVFVFFLGIFVLRKNIKSRINFTFFLHAITVTMWLFFTFMMFQSKGNIEMAIFWDRMVYLGVIFVPAFMYHFCLAFTNKKNNTLLYISYILSTIFIFLSRTDYFVKDVFIYKWGVHTKAQIFHHIFLIYFCAIVVTWFIQMFRYYRRLGGQSIKKEQTRYVFIAFLVLFSLGLPAYLPAYGIGIYPFSYIAGLLFVIILAYAIVNTRLMDIKLVLRQSTVYLTSLSLTLIPALFLKYLFDNFLPEYSYWIDTVIVIFSITIFPFFKERIYRFANKYLFSSLYDTKTVIKELSDKLGSTLETGTIYQTVTDVLSSALHMKALSFLACGVKKKDVRILFNSGLRVAEGMRSEVACKVIFGTYAGAGKMVILDELKNKPGRQDKVVSKALADTGAEVLVPLTVNDKSVGIIALGSKESGDSYNNEDLDLLKIVGSQTAIALENALLYEETKKFNVKLVKEVDRATHELKQANDELKTLDRAKSDFISIASHQLRTPLTVIKGYGSMMLEGSFGQMPAPIKDNVQKIYDSNERLINLVEDLLNVSRIESGRLQFNFELGQLDEMIASVVEELTANAAKKNLFLKFNKPKKAFPAIKMDKTKLRQVAINLIDNAIKYTEKGGITIDLIQEGDKLKFCVADTGMGIKAEEIPNLFKKFSRGEETSIIHTEGTGLGLYVGKMMIEAHGGRIWAESDGEGKGSRFCFELPIITTVDQAQVSVKNPKA